MLLEKINKKLEKDIKNLKLPQAIRLVIIFLKPFYYNKDEKELYSKITFKANSSLSFQKSDVHLVEFIQENDDIYVEMTLNFLSIFGSQSPMPSSYSEMVLRSYEQDRILYDFLNLFNHHLQRFIYPIWEKHRYYIQYKQDLSDSFSKYLLSFLGLGNISLKSDTKLNIPKLLCYSGLLSMRFQSAQSLKTILSHYLSHKDIEIIEFIPQKYIIPLEQNSKIGMNNSTLGDNFLIGEYVIGRNNKFKILLKNTKFDDLKAYSLLGDKLTELKELISFILHEPLSFELSLEIKKDEKKEYILANEEFFLGVNSWIGLNNFDEEIKVVDC